MELVGIKEIEDARERLAGVLRPTPVEVSDSLSTLCRRRVSLKHEERQRTGAFKIRGAYNLISRQPPGGEAVAASAGNHAQGVALAASLCGMRSTIFMPEGASIPKIEATRGYGADVRIYGPVVDDSIAAARTYALEQGALFVHPYDDPLVIAGQGTIGLEIADEAPEAEVVVVPVGGGGLISGVAAALKAAMPSVRVVGVEAEGSAAMRASLDAGECVTLDEISTIADGIAVKTASDLTLAHVREYVDEVVTVSDEEIGRTILLLLERAKAVVEPAGAAGLAAILAGKVEGTGQAVALLSGGNVDPLVVIKLIEFGLTATGRYLLLRIVLSDRPGTLAALTAAVARMGLNVLTVEHHRVGLHLGVDRVEVMLTVEARDPAHRAEILRALRADGYDVTLVD